MIVNTFGSVHGDESPNTTATVGTSEFHEFKAFGKIPRLSRDCVISEKIDGTNAHVYISDDGKTVLAGSRNRFVSPGKSTDNYGFAAWVEEHKEELLKLGPGRHYGEWWGKGINRGYGVDDKRFSLFNPKWHDESLRPGCCLVVPTLYTGPFNTEAIDLVLYNLEKDGSKAAPGFMQPEGIIIYHVAAAQYFKKTVLNDEKPKGQP